MIHISVITACAASNISKQNAANPTAMPQKPSSSLTLAPSPSPERLCGLAAVRTAAAIPVSVK
jgi:hypothetical protein